MEQEDLKDQLLQAAMVHVPFDGWSDATLRAAAADSGMDWPTACLHYPRRGVDLALAYHRQGDATMVAKLAATNLTAMRMRERIAFAVRTRIETADVELVRRGTTLFSLPQNAAFGAGAIWGTADAIWTALGDTKRDLNWYTKRATLSGVYGATVLFWLGDDSPDLQSTWEFLDRRIADVMGIEKLKAAARENPLTKAFTDGPAKVLESLQRTKDRWQDLGRKVP